MLKVNLSVNQRARQIPIRKLKKLVVSIAKNESLKIEQINLVFVSDKEIHKINREFLSHDYPTDVIAFDLSDEFSKVAEIYISVERAVEQAKRYGVDFESEIARLTAHGLLHLAGYDDKTKGEKLRMRRRENFYLQKFGF